MTKRRNPSSVQRSDAGAYAALSSGISRYLQCIEQFFPYAATQLTLSQHTEHAAEAGRYAPEELQLEREHLQEQLQGMIARAIRGSALVVLYSAFESTVMDFSNELAFDLQCAPFVPTSKSSFADQAEQHFATTFNLAIFSDRDEKERMDLLRLLRNSFVHQQSSFTRLPNRLQTLIKSRRTPLTQCEVNGNTWVPTAQCITAHGNEIQHWARLLSARVITRIGSDKYL